MIKKLIVCLGLSLASISYADSAAPADAGLVDAGSPGPAPSSALHDPTTDPSGALADLKAAATSKDKARWPLLALAVLVMLAKVVPFVAGKWGKLGAWLAKGRNAMIVASAGGIAMTAYDALKSGSSWWSAAITIGAALLALTTPHAPEAKAPEAAPSA